MHKHNFLKNKEDVLLKSKPEFFIVEYDYWEPEKDCVAIYEQISDKKCKEILSENIRYMYMSNVYM